ncbi:TC1 transposase-like protein [Elysia marginata]|uniref:TC1 transposase-like protein n=1 Tax=Elysia marginata TaxID=1093978 RepID=A0AAV4GD24_9GAST|nr:TC1 transposase-like protein [Elysia marginata]
MKKLKDAPAVRNSDRTKAQRLDFATWLLQNTQHCNLMYTDEVGIIRTRAQARRGDRPVRIVQGRRGQNLTMTFGVNVVNGLDHDELHQGGMTAERFNQFLHDTSLQCNPGQEVCFIFDNARAHGRAAGDNLPAQFEMQYLPPYQFTFSKYL